MKIRKIGLAANVFKEDIRAMISSVVGLIPDAIELIGLEELSGLVDGNRVRIAGSYAGCDVVVALGGDGTILRASRAVEKEQIPLLGLKMRSLGFLAEDDPVKAIGELLRGECIVQDRMRLEISHGGAGGIRETYTALNDVVLHGAGVSRVVHLKTKPGGTTLGEYLADGVIISTPTGSTAYSLAAGGPIINPVTMEAIIITPLCPHSLSVRPVVISSSEILSVEVVEGGRETMLTIDGQQACGIEAGETITVRKSARGTKLITCSDYDFYDLVSKKLRWGGVLRRH
ncbi:MAG: NAD(+)/NADH kinase [Candidatus Dadabacteria bacterium]|nr:NAD(+)/NADH kinase [Candidatus Dadabacteria bacterium]